jgi:hypothetical protein
MHGIDRGRHRTTALADGCNVRMSWSLAGRQLCERADQVPMLKR